MIIEKIKNPEDLKPLSIEDLNALAREIRDIIIQTVAQNGGHLASNLGSVDLTIALHYVFDSPKDKIIWDVGHQAYTHKLLTGRYPEFHTIRKQGGLSGFPKISESPHDAFGTGHSSTSISAALGILAAGSCRRSAQRAFMESGDPEHGRQLPDVPCTREHGRFVDAASPATRGSSHRELARGMTHLR